MAFRMLLRALILAVACFVCAKGKEVIGCHSEDFGIFDCWLSVDLTSYILEMHRVAVEFPHDSWILQELNHW